MAGPRPSFLVRLARRDPADDRTYPRVLVGLSAKTTADRSPRGLGAAVRATADPAAVAWQRHSWSATATASTAWSAHRAECPRRSR